MSIQTFYVMLHPGEVRSKADGDIHFIGAQQLIYLYNVLNTDKVVTYNERNPTHSKEFLENSPIRYIHLYPRNDGNYEDIHRLDQYEPIRPKSKT